MDFRKSLSQGSSFLSDTLEFLQAKEDRSEPLTIAKIASNPGWEFMVAAIFSKTHCLANSWLRFAYFFVVKRYKPIILHHCRKF